MLFKDRVKYGKVSYPYFTLYPHILLIKSDIRLHQRSNMSIVVKHSNPVRQRSVMSKIAQTVIR